MFYVNYNDIDLTGIVDVKDVITTALPPRDNKTIDIWERQGSIYNGYKYKEREIKVTFIIQPTQEEILENEDILNEKIEDIKRAFDVDGPKALFLGDESKFIFAVPQGDIEINQIGINTCEGEVNFICYDPMYYSEEAKQYDNEEGNNIVICDNEGSVECYPIIDIGISKDCHFVQVENTLNKKKILVGTYPEMANTTIKEKATVLSDNCEQTTDWIAGSSSVDSDRATNGTLSVTESGAGITAGDFGSKSSGANWYGTSARKNLNAQVKDFYVECVMRHNSPGKNGDPNTGDNETETVVSGSKKTYYKVKCTSLNVRSGPGTRYRRVGALKKNTKVYPSSVSKHWAKIQYKGKTAYVSTDYLRKCVSSNTVTATRKNFVTHKSTAIRSTYKKTSKDKCTIKTGQVIRCITSKKYLDPTDKKKERYYYKLAQKYKGHSGYVAVANLTAASNTFYDYEIEPDTADDKVGMVELYGYTANNEKLFRIGLYDDNEWYEFTYPLIQVGSKDFLKDKTVAPAPKTITRYEGNNDKLTVTKDALLSGKYGSWNEFYGKLGIQRKNGKWKAWIYKIKDGKTVKQLPKKEVKISGSPTGNLAYIVAYFGTFAETSEKACDMAINHVNVKNLNPKTTINQNVTIFEEGDTLKVDCYNNEVHLNDKPYNSKVDIGSQFFPLEIGENTIKVSSDDTDISTSVIFNERWL